MYTIAINTEPMAIGARGVPLVTVNPIVRTRKKVPTNSVTYRLICINPDPFVLTNHRMVLAPRRRVTPTNTTPDDS
jgi:hypothetical protein